MDIKHSIESMIAKAIRLSAKQWSLLIIKGVMIILIFSLIIEAPQVRQWVEQLSE